MISVTTNDDATQAWERQRGEPSRAFHAFCHFRDLGVGRSIAIAFRSHQQTCLHRDGTARASRARYSRSWGGWSAGWGWVQRSECWDGDVEKQVRARAAKDLVDVQARHLRVVQGQLQATMVSTRVVLETLQQDPGQLATLVAEARTSTARLLDHVDRASRSVHATVELISSERLILGMSTERLEIDDRRQEMSRAMTDKLLKNPLATDLLIEALNLVAGENVTEEPS